MSAAADDSAMEDAAAPAAAEGAGAESDAAVGLQPEGGAAPMETEEVMVKKKRTRKVVVPVVAHTLSPTEGEVSVSSCLETDICTETLYLC